jgi:membrane-associated protease RseP (regulator of RpoE activity)
VWKRIVIMLGGPIMNLLIAIVCITVLVTGCMTPVESTPARWPATGGYMPTMAT